MEIENLESWRKAGQIAAQALKYGEGLIKPGASLLEVSDKIEEKIISLGGEMAFPAQISLDNIAAHYCAHPNDKIVFDKQLCCLDVGVHVDGCIGDNALTVDLSGEQTELVEASRAALNAAIDVVKSGVSLGKIGKAIQEQISSRGFAPVINLSGHGLGKFEIHSRPSIPNYNNHDSEKLSDGQIVAIEPFATDGKGAITESSNPSIFSLENKKPVRNIYARKLITHLQKYNRLPFTTRWLTNELNNFPVDFALKTLLQEKVIRAYPPLVELKKGIVSQAEHTILVTEDGCEILTKV